MAGKLETIQTGTDITMTLNADTALIGAGGKGQGGDIVLSDKVGNPVVNINSDNHRLFFRAPPGTGQFLGDVTIDLVGATSSLVLSVGGKRRIHLDAINGNIYLGGNGAKGDLFVYGADETDNTDGSKAAIRLDGASGDIILKNADCAEDFPVAGAEIAPGTV